MHLLKWAEVCKPKHQGGLGVSSLSLRNSVLLFKWWWRGNKERSSFWNQFLRAKYGFGQSFDFQLLKSSNASSSTIKDIQSVGNYEARLLDLWRVFVGL